MLKSLLGRPFARLRGSIGNIKKFFDNGPANDERANAEVIIQTFHDFLACAKVSDAETFASNHPDTNASVFDIELGFSKAASSEGYLEIALAHARKAFYSAPSNVWGCYNLLQLLLTLGHLEDANQLLSKTNDSLLSHRAIAMLHARLKYKQKEYQTALQIIDLILQEDPESINAALLQGEILERLSGPEKAVKFYQNLIHRSPDSKAAHLRLASLYTKMGNADRAIASLGDIYWELRSIFFDRLQNFGEPGSSLGGNPFTLPNWLVKEFLHREFVTHYSSESKNCIERILDIPTSTDEAGLEWFFHLKNDANELASNNETSRPLSMQDAFLMLQDGNPRIFNPFTGKISTAVLSLLPNFAMLRDTPEKVYVSFAPVLMAAFTIETTFILPERKLLLHLYPLIDSKELVTDLLAPDVSSLVNGFCGLDQYAIEVYQSKGITASDFPISHLGHYVWNGLSAWDSLHISGLAKRADILVSWEKGDFFGNPFELYPEFERSGCNTMRVSSKESAVRHLKSTNNFWLPLLSRYVTNDMARRVRDASKQRMSTSSQHEILEFIDSKRPIIVLGVRLGNRYWVNQETGFQELIKKIHNIFPQAAFVIDGMNSGADSISTHAFMDTSGEKLIASNIRKNAPPEVPILSVVGTPIEYSIEICSYADVFVAPWGTAMAKYKWIENLPGIALGNSLSANPDKPRSGTRVFHRFRDTPSAVVDIPIEHVTDCGFGNLEEPLRENFDVPWELVAEELLRLLKSLGYSPVQS